MNAKFKTIFLLLVLLFIFSFAVGCAQATVESSETEKETSTETTEPTPSETAEEEPEEASEEPSEELEPSPTEREYIILGIKEANSSEAILENKTAETITALSVKLSDEEEFGENLLPEDTEFKDGEFAKLYLEPLKFNNEDNIENARDDAEENEEGISEDDVEFNEYYDMKLVFEDEKEYIIYDFSFDNIDEAKILFSKADNVCYLKYESKITGEQVNTLEAQKAMKTALEEDDETEEEKTVSQSSASKSQEIPDSEPVYDYVPEPVQEADPAPAAPEPIVIPDPVPAPEQYVDDCLEENVEFFD